MLIKCPECELQVSDKALSCPHCGYPLVKTPYTKRKSSKKHMRLPNGFGQISEIKNSNLRKPFRAMVTVGKNEFGKPIQKILKPEGYFETYIDAYNALMEYRKNPYDLNDDITVKELYEKWSVEYFKTLKGDAGVRNVKSAWSYCGAVYFMRAKDLRARHIKACMEEGTAVVKDEIRTVTAGVKTRIKSLFNLMLDYALEYELVDRNYARTFQISDDIIKEVEAAKRGHMIFSDDEINILLENINYPYVDVLLIQCYSGWRPQELGLIKRKDVDIENWWFIGGMKTNAGTNRLVPIHTKIRELVLKRYKESEELGSEYLINCTDTHTHRSNLKFTYDKYRHRFDDIRNDLKLHEDHRPHDGRMHFITKAKKYEVDEYAIKYMVGHSIDDITEKVYTEREKEWLQKEIEKIK